MIDLSNLKGMAIFATVVERGSFATAAQQLGMSRSAVSEQVARLESQLNVRLLQRSTRALSLTTDGEKLLPHANLVLQSAEDTSAALQEDASQGLIRLTTTNDVMIHWLMPRIDRFREQYPEVRFDFRISDDLVDLIQNKIDLAIRVAAPRTNGFVARHLFDDKMFIYATPEFLLRYDQPKTLDDLQYLRWILIHKVNPNNLVTLNNAQGKEAVITPKIYDHVDAPIIQREMIESGRAIGLQIEGLMAEEENKGNVVRLFPDWYIASLNFHLLYPSRKHLPLRVKYFVEFLLANR